MPSDCMAIVNSHKDCSRVSKYYNDVAGVRVVPDGVGRG